MLYTSISLTLPTKVLKEETPLRLTKQIRKELKGYLTKHTELTETQLDQIHITGVKRTATYEDIYISVITEPHYIKAFDTLGLIVENTSKKVG